MPLQINQAQKAKDLFYLDLDSAMTNANVLAVVIGDFNNRH